MENPHLAAICNHRRLQIRCAATRRTEYPLCSVLRCFGGRGRASNTAAMTFWSVQRISIIVLDSPQSLSRACGERLRLNRPSGRLRRPSGVTPDQRHPPNRNQGYPGTPPLTLALMRCSVSLPFLKTGPVAIRWQCSHLFSHRPNPRNPQASNSRCDSRLSTPPCF
jgi:hypothetical protein